MSVSEMQLASYMPRLVGEYRIYDLPRMQVYIRLASYVSIQACCSDAYLLTDISSRYAATMETILTRAGVDHTKVRARKCIALDEAWLLPLDPAAREQLGRMIEVRDLRRKVADPEPRNPQPATRNSNPKPQTLTP